MATSMLLALLIGESSSHAKHPDMITTCLIYNASWAKKPKKEFVRIRWFDNPSMYETNRTKEIEEWCPIDWLKKV